MKKRWCIKEPDEETQRLLSQELDISPIVAQVLINRGIKDVEQAHRFLFPSLSHLHSPLMMKDMEKALERIIKAIFENEKIVIYGDYDVDGITSVAVLITFLREVNADASYYIPHRLSEGYGLNPEALEKISSLGTNLLITVDCGIMDFQEIHFAQRNGIDVIVTDHHEIPDVLPPAYAILNPKQKGCNFPFKSLAGVGIVFNLIIALRTRLRDMGFWNNQKVPNLKEYLDLVALGTIADIVPLTDENRIFVKFGLEQLTNSSRPGVIALKEVSGLKDTVITPGMVGFRLAPRINAAGRLSRGDEGVRLLITKDLKEAEDIANILDSENTERQQIENRILEEAKGLVENNEGLLTGKAIILVSPDWHPGVIGIVASRLAEEYYKPTVMISLDGETGKGSARSIEGFHLYEGLKGCAYLLEGFGGHKYAAGLTIDEKNIPEFQNLFEEIVKKTLSEEDFIPKIHIDAHIALRELTEGFLKELDTLSPFGPSNPEPTFCSSILAVSDFKVVGNRHLKLKVKEEGVVYDAIGFNMGKDIFPLDQCIKAAFVPQINDWNGTRTIQLRLKDIQVLSL
ncbi:MAG: single-stranded-DNA-specific exonuclease RecJ [Desulfobacterales bacterium]|nr:single-stranded-DNA-specific exonuclease RecJ [Desulfobacterales bacterium]